MRIVGVEGAYPRGPSLCLQCGVADETVVPAIECAWLNYAGSGYTVGVDHTLEVSQRTATTRRADRFGYRRIARFVLGVNMGVRIENQHTAICLAVRLYSIVLGRSHLQKSDAALTWLMYTWPARVGR